MKMTPGVTLNQSQLLDLQLEGGATDDCFPQTVAFLEEHEEVRAGLSSAANELGSEYKSFPDALFCWLFPGFDVQCKRFYAGQGPPLREITPESRRVLFDGLLFMAVEAITEDPGKTGRNWRKNHEEMVHKVWTRNMGTMTVERLSTTVPIVREEYANQRKKDEEQKAAKAKKDEERKTAQLKKDAERKVAKAKKDEERKTAQLKKDAAGAEERVRKMEERHNKAKRDLAHARKTARKATAKAGNGSNPSGASSGDNEPG